MKKQLLEIIRIILLIGIGFALGIFFGYFA